MNARKLTVNDMLVKAFVAEGVEVLFTLMGDANMYWSAAMAGQPGVKVIHARHEHAAVAMADGYARATGRVGVASTTCGPGFTQIMTALTMAARANTPMVVFAGDAPLAANWYLQQIDQAPLALATGAHFIAVKSLDRVLDNVREAFVTARVERRPVVLSIPMDLQKKDYPFLAEYMTSAGFVPAPQRPIPDPDMVERVVDMIAEAERPIVLAGRGAARAGARAALEALADRAGALLANSLLGKAMFEGNPFAIGIAGAFASDFARERFAEADLVIGVGASLGHYTTEGGYLYPMAQVVQIDTDPRGLWQGLRTADLHVRADARTAAQAIVEALDRRGVSRPGFRSPEMAAAVAADRPDGKEFAPQPNLLDPRKTILELDAAVPKDWDVVCGVGHYFSIAMTHMTGRPTEKYHVIGDFGGIGSGLPAAIGVAADRGDGKVLLIEGDGSLYLHVQELETIRRHGIQLLIAIMNDGGYGAEFHKFRAGGHEPKEAIHGRGDLAGVATGFGLRGATVSQPGRCAALFEEHQAANSAGLWDFQIDDLIPSRAYRRIHYGEA